MKPGTLRVAGIAALASAACSLGAIATDARQDGPWTHRLVAAHALLLLPALVVLTVRLARDRPDRAWFGAAAGTGGLLLWTVVALRDGPWSLEWVWLGLTAVWWLAHGFVLVVERRGLGNLTMGLGVAAVLDALVTSLAREIPFWAIALLGAWKLPLELIWTVWLGLELTRGRAW